MQPDAFPAAFSIFAARTAAHLKPGTELEARMEDGVVQLEPVVKPARLIQRRRLIVAVSEEALPTLEQQKVNEALEEVRGAGSRRER